MTTTEEEQPLKHGLFLTLCVLLLLVPTGGHSGQIRDIHPLLLISQRGRVLMVIRHTHGVGNIAPVIAQMEQDIHALEVIFEQMLDAGKLDEGFQYLVIQAAFTGEIASRFDYTATRLSRSSGVALAGWGLSLEEIVQLRGAGRVLGSTLSLGGAYVIETTTGLVTLDDLLALMHMLPGLGQGDLF